MSGETRTSRNELLLGAAGQARIRQTSVAIIGLGGLGSHVAQQLAYLGTLDFVLVDDDIVTLTSLNRLVGAGPHDAAAGRPKVEVAERHIRYIEPKARVRFFARTVGDPMARAAIESSTVVFGCVDKDPPRLAIVELTAPRDVPYFDLATDVSDDGSQYGGRVLASVAGERCLYCMGLIDQAQLREATQTPEQAAEDERIYGVRRRVLDAEGPSVVSLNGVIASLGVTEFMAWVTGMREPCPYLVYHGETGVVNRNRDAPAARCPYCGR